jgi:hypothetical protein
MNENLKLAFIILTCESNIGTLTNYQKQTFLINENIEDIFFLSATTYEGRYFSYNSPDTYEFCPIKYIRFFKNIELNYDFFLFIDDDTFVDVKKLKKLLNSIKLSYRGPLYIGYTDQLIVDHYMDSLNFNKDLNVYFTLGKLPRSRFGTYFCLSGGGGFVLNQDSYQIISKVMLESKEKDLYDYSYCERTRSYYTDIMISNLLYMSDDYKNITSILCSKFKSNYILYKKFPLKLLNKFLKIDFITAHYVKKYSDFRLLNNFANNNES